MSSMNLIELATVTRSSSVVPTHVYATGEVCPMTDHLTVSLKRRASVAQATFGATAWATAPGYRQPWSPPVT